MRFKLLKNSKEYFWTEHAKYKMQYYGLGAQKILGVIRRPKRKEEGIVKDTIAVMLPQGSVKRPTEIWVMFQLKNFKFQNPNSKQIPRSKFQIEKSAKKQIRIISAWRYPGVSPKRNPIPQEILEEIKNIKN